MQTLIFTFLKTYSNAAFGGSLPPAKGFIAIIGLLDRLISVKAIFGFGNIITPSLFIGVT